MCDTCGCNITDGNKDMLEPGGKLEKTESGHESIEVLQNLLHENNHQATHNREHFDKNQVLAINLMSSPGSGKTSLLEATIDALKGELSVAVIEGDLETENDAQRIRDKKVPAIQIQTGSACHLDAHMAHHAVHELNLENLDIVFIENVGNLVCPASFDLGHHLNVTLLSVTEGDDKPAKYPVMFRGSNLHVMTKVDLLPYLDDFKIENAEQNIRNLANPSLILKVSAKNQQGISEWIDWLKQQINLHRQLLAQGQTLLPKMQSDGTKLHAHEHNH
ncbi:MAG: hydrogenase nickel incorporation protein HypB [Gammaproteobacteria bacterium]|nr:hydrogenase nickel incorporation protein HypB [Gammaproteobacteria bacterium]